MGITQQIKATRKCAEIIKTKVLASCCASCNCDEVEKKSRVFGERKDAKIRMISKRINALIFLIIFMR